MFKKLFSKEADKPQPAAQDAGGRVKTTSIIEENPGESATVAVNVDAQRDFWKGLNINKNKNQSFRRLRDVYGTLPEHFANRIKEIDHCLGQTLAETHKTLVLIISELFRQNAENPLFIESSQEWQDWYERLERSNLEFRKNNKVMIHELLGQLKYKDKDVNRLNQIIEARPGEIEQLTGLDKIEDLKSNLIDIATILGKDSENKIVQNITDEPVRVDILFNRTSSTASSTTWTSSKR